MTTVAGDPESVNECGYIGGWMELAQKEMMRWLISSRKKSGMVDWKIWQRKSGGGKEVKLRQKRRVSERRIDTLWFVTDSATLYYERKHERCAPSLSQDEQPVRERWLLRSGPVCIYYCSVTMCYKLRPPRDILCLRKQRKWSSFGNFFQPPAEMSSSALSTCISFFFFLLFVFFFFLHSSSTGVVVLFMFQLGDSISRQD